MGRRYWIPNLPTFRKHLPSEEKGLMKIHGQNIVELESEDDLRKLIESIRKEDFVSDQQIKEFYDANFPEISTSLKGTPIQLDELKLAFRRIFSDLPDEFFEEKDVVVVLRKCLNFVIWKKETFYILTNINKLEIKDSYKGAKYLEFYYQMDKLSYDLEEYYSFLWESQKIVQKMILQNIIFSNKKIKVKDLEMINRGLNLSGYYFLEFKDKLDIFMTAIRENKRFIKRSRIDRFLPPDYNEREVAVVQRIKLTSEDLDNKISRIQEMKKTIGDEIRSKKEISRDKLKMYWDLFWAPLRPW